MASYSFLVVDMQHGYLKPYENTYVGGENGFIARCRKFDPKERERMVTGVLGIAEVCRENGIPIVKIEKITGPGETIDEISAAFKEGTYRTIQKEGMNSFTGTNLEKLLQGWKVDSLILAGVFASACIKATACEAKRKGYEVFTAEDLIGNCKGELTNDAIRELEEYCTIFPTHQKIKKLLENGSKQEFGRS